MGAAAVLGLQGGQLGPYDYRPNASVCSLGKHFAAYGAATGALNGGPAAVSNLTLSEIYLRPWLALGLAGVRAVMPAHNSGRLEGEGDHASYHTTCERCWLVQSFFLGYGVTCLHVSWDGDAFHPWGMAY